MHDIQKLQAASCFGTPTACVTCAVIGETSVNAAMEQSLQSVFLQDYPNIQLIVTMDRLSVEAQDYLIHYVNDHKTSNITRILLQNHQRALSEAQRMEWCLSHAIGEWLILLQGGDVFCDSRALSYFVGYATQLLDCGTDVLGIGFQVGIGRIDISNRGEAKPSARALESLMTTAGQGSALLAFVDEILPCSILFRCQNLAQAGGFDGNDPVLSLSTLLVRAVAQAHFVTWLLGVIGVYRQTQTLGSVDHASREAQWMLMYKQEIIDRRELFPPDMVAYAENFVLQKTEQQENSKIEHREVQQSKQCANSASATSPLAWLASRDGRLRAFLFADHHVLVIYLLAGYLLCAGGSSVFSSTVRSGIRFLQVALGAVLIPLLCFRGFFYMGKLIRKIWRKLAPHNQGAAL